MAPGSTSDLVISYIVIMQDKLGETALITAAGRGHTSTCRVLLDHGANIDLQNKVIYQSSYINMHFFVIYITTIYIRSICLSFLHTIG